MELFNFIGIIGGFLFFIKVGIHIYIKTKMYKKFALGDIGRYTNPLFFFPITESVNEKLKFYKKGGNIIYFISIMSILIFLAAKLLS
jgi:hypothetical protein